MSAALTLPPRALSVLGVYFPLWCRAGRHEAQSRVGPGCSRGVRMDRQSDSQTAVRVSALNCRELPWPGRKVDLGGDCH